jgi:transposase-like protein
LNDEARARQYFENLRWPDGPVCPHCELVNGAYKITPKAGSRTRQGLWKCKACRGQFSVTVKSIFADSHIPLEKWLRIVHCFCGSPDGVNIRQLWRAVGFGSYRTAWLASHRILWALSQEPLASMVKRATSHRRHTGRSLTGNEIHIPLPFETALKGLLQTEIGSHEPGK